MVLWISEILSNKVVFSILTPIISLIYLLNIMSGKSVRKLSHWLLFTLQECWPNKTVISRISRNPLFSWRLESKENLTTLNRRRSQEHRMNVAFVYKRTILTKKTQRDAMAFTFCNNFSQRVLQKNISRESVGTFKKYFLTGWRHNTLWNSFLWPNEFHIFKFRLDYYITFFLHLL